MNTSSTEDCGIRKWRANESSNIQPSVENNISIEIPTVNDKESSEDSHKNGVKSELKSVYMKFSWSMS